MKLNSFEEKIHSLIIVIMVVIFAFYIFLTKNYYAYLPVYLYCLGFIWFQGQDYKIIFKTVLGSFIFSFFCAYFVVFFPNDKFLHLTMIDFLYWKIPEQLIVNQFRVFLQVGLISGISFLSIRSINFEKIIIYLMKNKWMGAYLGYPILLALNSISLLKSELDKIRINLKMRQLPAWHVVDMLFPLLVFAVRHADRGALSLITRGLNEDKAYYFDVELTNLDKTLLSILIILVFVCTAL